MWHDIHHTHQSRGSQMFLELIKNQSGSLDEVVRRYAAVVSLLVGREMVVVDRRDGKWIKVLNMVVVWWFCKRV